MKVKFSIHFSIHFPQFSNENYRVQFFEEKISDPWRILPQNLITCTPFFFGDKRRGDQPLAALPQKYLSLYPIFFEAMPPIGENKNIKPFILTLSTHPG